MLIDWFTVAAQLLNFLVLVWLMKRFLYQPILAAIAAREKLIAAELADAAARQGAAQHLGAEFAAKSSAFDQQRAALLAEAVAAAKASNAALLEQGQATDAAQRAQHAAALAAEQQRLCAGITLRARDEVLAAVRQALSDLGDETLEAAMVRSFMRRLEQLDPPSRASLAAALAADPASAEVRSAFTLDATQQAALSAALGATGIAPQALKFGPAPDLLCGIEFRLKGWSLAWNLDQYLQDFAQRSGSLLQGNAVAAGA
jgi:F-type H+-transporting ATPase subunit b